VSPLRELPTIDDLAGDAHPHLARLRAAAPVAWVPALDSFLVSGWAAAVEVLRDPATFTVDDPRFSTARVVGSSMLSLDGAAHIRHRAPFTVPFRPRRVAERFGDVVQREVGQLLDAIASGGSDAELRSQLAGPLAAAVVAVGLGIDDSSGGRIGVARLLGWYRAIVDSVSTVGAGRPPTAAGARAMDELGAALLEHLAEETGDHGSLLQAAMSDGELDPDEVVSNAAVIMFGGIETTEGALLNAVWYLLREPDLYAAIVDEPGLVPAAVEESLRIEPAAAVVDRYATRDVELAGCAISGGSQVTVSLAGANRDPAVFADPDRFEIHRPQRRQHLAFAAGPHVCVGMDLARLEVVTAVMALAARFPRLRLAADAPPPTGLVFRKPVSLPVVLR
jgi:cytochrome P450